MPAIVYRRFLCDTDRAGTLHEQMFLRTLTLTTEQMATRAASWLSGGPRSASTTSRVGGGRRGPL